MDIGPGDWVEYVGNSETRLSLRTGSVWCVSAIVPVESDVRCGSCGQHVPFGLRLAGMKYPASVSEESSFHHEHFRPFHGPEIEKQQFKLKEPA